jgi:hypothetical protein
MWYNAVPERMFDKFPVKGTHPNEDISGTLPLLMCKFFSQQITHLVAGLSNAVALWNTFCFWRHSSLDQLIQFPCVTQQQYPLYFSSSFQHRFPVNIWCGYIHYHLDWFYWESCIENLPLLWEEVSSHDRFNLWLKHDDASPWQVTEYLNLCYRYRWIDCGERRRASPFTRLQ